jgi:hypothetical protein
LGLLWPARPSEPQQHQGRPRMAMSNQQRRLPSALLQHHCPATNSILTGMNKGRSRVADTVARLNIGPPVSPAIASTKLPPSVHPCRQHSTDQLAAPMPPRSHTKQVQVRLTSYYCSRIHAARQRHQARAVLPAAPRASPAPASLTSTSSKHQAANHGLLIELLDLNVGDKVGARRQHIVQQRCRALSTLQNSSAARRTRVVH